MANFRTSRCRGTHSPFFSHRTPGILGFNDAADPFSPDWLIGDTPGPLGIHDCGDPFIGMTVVGVKEPDEDEFKLLKEHISDASASAYLTHRRTFFGTDEAYKSYAAEADFELDNSTLQVGKKQVALRSKIDLTGKTQTVFYRWVRKAYQKHGIKDVPALIWQQNSEALKQVLVKVKANYTGAFHPQGFVPRPQKLKGKFLLGTLSNHALGGAVDIEPDFNAQLTGAEWKFIEKLTGKTVGRTANRWKDQPEALWKDVRDLSDLFIAKVAAEEKRIGAEREAAAKVAAANQAPAGLPPPKAGAHAAKPKALPPPIDTVLAGHLDLKKWIEKKGFFNLEWALVKELHAVGLKWGVLFPSPDLHHFELKQA